MGPNKKSVTHLFGEENDIKKKLWDSMKTLQRKGIFLFTREWKSDCGLELREKRAELSKNEEGISVIRRNVLAARFGKDKR